MSKIIFNKAEAVSKAMELFWHKGYKGTSLEDLTDALDIGKGSFYNTFKSKRNLFEYCIDIYRNNSIDDLTEILNAEKDIKKGLCNFLKNNLDYAIKDPQHRGCFLTNICAELASTDEKINKLMNDHYTLMRKIITNYLSNGSDFTIDVINDITNTIITFFIGMTVEVKLNNNNNNNRDRIESSINRLINSLF